MKKITLQLVRKVGLGAIFFISIWSATLQRQNI